MPKLRLPHDSLVLVADGRKALFLRNEGDEKFPNLVTARVIKHDNPATHLQGSDRPGRVYESSSHRRSSIEPTDWHVIEEHRFAKEVAALVEKYINAEEARALVVVAPARTLGDLRAEFATTVRNRIVAEITKDLTKHPLSEIENHLLQAAR